ncbi:hypothetical protein B296_00028935 [Ensete ventricosum]|uniref:Uncharacterized protein n=1 Tax=Ensete ventricosum TaxID=4639 RepID=A0A426Y1I0_ENSVE|nr:hypothetical protein B296_00028935 [Ensete ventricosum]
MTQSDRPRGEVHVSYSRLSGPCTMHATRRPPHTSASTFANAPGTRGAPLEDDPSPAPAGPTLPVLPSSFPFTPGARRSTGIARLVVVPARMIRGVARRLRGRSGVGRSHPHRSDGCLRTTPADLRMKVEMDRRLMAKGERKAQGNMPASPAAAASSCFHARGRRMGCCRGEAKRRITASRIPVLRRVPHLYPTCAAPSPCLPLPRDPSTAHYF